MDLGKLFLDFFSCMSYFSPTTKLKEIRHFVQEVKEQASDSSSFDLQVDKSDSEIGNMANQVNQGLRRMSMMEYD